MASSELLCCLSSDFSEDSDCEHVQAKKVAKRYPVILFRLLYHTSCALLSALVPVVNVTFTHKWTTPIHAMNARKPHICLIRRRLLADAQEALVERTPCGFAAPPPRVLAQLVGTHNPPNISPQRQAEHLFM
jgi:hypothetical protein